MLQWSWDNLHEVHGNKADPHHISPLMLFIDSTTLDKNGKNTATPILATLLIFTMAVLKMDISKVLLGYLPKCDLH
jgi:hypothetical protein